MNPFNISFDPKAAFTFAGTNPAFSFTTQGLSKLGMLQTPTPAAQDPLATYRAGYNKRFAELQQAIGKDKDSSGLGFALMASNLGTPPEQLEAQAALRKQEAEAANKMSRENAEIAEQYAIRRQGREALYNAIGGLPGSIASAFGGVGERQMMADLYGGIPQIVSETYRTFPRQQITPVASSTQSTKYFS